VLRAVVQFIKIWTFSVLKCFSSDRDKTGGLDEIDECLTRIHPMVSVFFVGMVDFKHRLYEFVRFRGIIMAHKK